MILNDYLENVGNTPLLHLEIDHPLELDLYAKLEFCNPTGSVKDRAANHIIQKLLDRKEINKDTTLIESSSGNFGIALAAYCKKHGLKFIAVIDPCINPINQTLMQAYGATVIKVDVPDCNGGYLLNRIEKVKQLKEEIDNSYWVNQYGNPYNAEAYYKTLGQEICDSMEYLDYLFLGISSGGTITGVSQKVKERFPDAQVVAVDIYGSVIFGNPPRKRYIPGIGSSMVPDIIKQAKIDDVVMVDEVATIDMCNELLCRYNIFAGGSSGSVLAGIKKYFSNSKINGRKNIATIFPDRGDRYATTVYNSEWCEHFKNSQK
jgi:cysteine synthase A